ncbi:MAG: class I SAM-dependent methyltransferase [Betaproteobacteria bacterium AqS2]|uniref:Ribosomal RNA small subunit methyltransferase G n=1 Tax=Candidatus Amphirhobacter heronislandensis TaxID=1732024 RepID=A0A930UHI5_9GAMM|nr:class I SAM-dependent methyltransferase [Betaproteobacteria bacterium AqS2]
MPEQAPGATLSQSFPQASAAAIARLEAYVALLAKWAKVHNLVGARGPAAILNLVRDCRPLLQRARELPGPACDLGAGAGLPGLPLALLQPRRPVALVEAEASKCAFLQQAVIELGVRNAAVVHARVEQWRPAKPPRLLCVRGLARLAAVARLARRFTAPGVRLLALKAREPAAEIAELEQLGGWRLVACGPADGRPSRHLVEAEAT